MKSLLISLLLLFQMTLCAEIYDCFTFFNELELLKLRFEELYDVVDHFVIVESRISFTGKEKPLYFAENAEKFEKYKDKITHIVIDHFPGLTGDAEKDHWAREAYSRNVFLKGLTNCKKQDLIFISDLDEIPSAAIIPKIKQSLENEQMKRSNKKGPLIYSLNMRLFMYDLNRENFSGWSGGSKATTYAVVKKLSPWGIKIYHHNLKHDLHIVENAGWHFNTMGGKEKALYKWLLTGPLFDAEEALNELGKNETLLQQSYEGQVKNNTVLVPIDAGFPKYIRENLGHYRSIGWIADK